MAIYRINTPNGDGFTPWTKNKKEAWKEAKKKTGKKKKYLKSAGYYKEKFEQNEEGKNRDI